MTKILLVEDDKSLREIYGVRLRAEGYEIVSAGDGEEALALAIKERPQLILSDVMMPKISGFDMLDILRSTTETKDIKVIMMTALSSEDQRERGESLGADKYLVKSQVGIEDVVRTVHEVLGDTPMPTNTANVFAQPTGPRTSMPTANMQPIASPQANPAPAAPQPQQTQQAPAQQPQQPQQPQPQQPTPQPAPQQPTPTAPQQQPTAPQQAQPAPTPSQAPSRLPADSLPTSGPNSGAQGGTLPRPTAPFSTDRPAGLGDRIIHPIDQSADGKRDLSALMAQELNSEPAAPTQAQQPTPQPAPQQPTPTAPQQQPATPQQAQPQAPATPQYQPSQPQQAPAQQPQQASSNPATSTPTQQNPLPIQPQSPPEQPQR